LLILGRWIQKKNFQNDLKVQHRAMTKTKNSIFRRKFFLPKLYKILLLPQFYATCSELVISCFVRISTSKLSKEHYCFPQKLFCFVCLVMQHFTYCMQKLGFLDPEITIFLDFRHMRNVAQLNKQKKISLEERINVLYLI